MPCSVGAPALTKQWPCCSGMAIPERAQLLLHAKTQYHPIEDEYSSWGKQAYVGQPPNSCAQLKNYMEYTSCLLLKLDGTHTLVLCNDAAVELPSNMHEKVSLWRQGQSADKGECLCELGLPACAS